MSAPGHYLLVVLPEGKEDVRREYLPLLHEDETMEEATDRWVELKLGNRQRNRAKVGSQLLNSIIGRRICRPTSWHRANKTLAFAEPVPGGKKSRRRAA